MSASTGSEHRNEGGLLASIPVLVTHYTKLSSRKEFILKELSRVGIESAQFIESYDKEDLNKSVLGQYYKEDAETWIAKYFFIRKIMTENAFYSHAKKSWGEGVKPGAYIGTSPRRLKDSEISLSMKHIQAYKTIIDQDWNYAVIIEDDVIFNDGFQKDFSNNLLATPADWDVIFFGSGCGFRVPERTEEKSIYRMLPPRGKCSDSYVISRKAAERFLNHMVPFTHAIDFEIVFWMNFLNMKCYWWEPSMTSQGSQTGSFSSSIQ